MVLVRMQVGRSRPPVRFDLGHKIPAGEQVVPKTSGRGARHAEGSRDYGDFTHDIPFRRLALSLTAHTQCAADCKRNPNITIKYFVLAFRSHPCRVKPSSGSCQRSSTCFLRTSVEIKAHSWAFVMPPLTKKSCAARHGPQLEHSISRAEGSSLFFTRVLSRLVTPGRFLPTARRAFPPSSRSVPETVAVTACT